MEIHLKDTLRGLRQKKNITQETLADYLGITPQSVGKWERSEGYPDITMLPRLALYFDVTVDDLLDVGQDRIDRTIEDYIRKSTAYNYEGEKEKNLALWEEAYREFPNDCRVISGLMHALCRMGVWPYPQADRIISLGERILQESNDTQLREGVLPELCNAYKSLGNNERAMYYAGKGGNLYTTRDALAAFVQEGEEGIKACQNYILSLLEEAARTAVYELPGKEGITAEEEIRICRFGIGLLELLFSDGNTGYYANYLSVYYTLLADKYASVENGEGTLEALDKAKKYALESAAEKAGAYTALLVNRLKHDPARISKNYRGNACDLMLENLKWESFDSVRDSGKFSEIEREVKRSACFAQKSGA